MTWQSSLSEINCHCALTVDWGSRPGEDGRQTIQEISLFDALVSQLTTSHRLKHGSR
jgi:hypothetical protein